MDLGGGPELLALTWAAMAGQPWPGSRGRCPLWLPFTLTFPGAAADFSAISVSRHTQPTADLSPYDMISVINGSIYMAGHSLCLVCSLGVPRGQTPSLLPACQPQGRTMSAAGDPHHPQHHPCPPLYPPVVCAGGNQPPQQQKGPQPAGEVSHSSQPRLCQEGHRRGVKPSPWTTGGTSADNSGQKIHLLGCDLQSTIHNPASEL